MHGYKSIHIHQTMKIKNSARVEDLKNLMKQVMVDKKEIPRKQIKNTVEEYVDI